MIDFYNDPGHGTLRHLLQRAPAAAEMLKTAELEDFNTELPSSAFAWESRRLYPVHSPVHAAVSYLYAKHASVKVPREVIGFIKEALDIYGIEEGQLAETQVKEAALAEDECLFPESRTYPVRDAGEEIEALARAGDGLGQQFPGDAGERDAVTGEPLQKIDVGLEPPEMRRAVHRDVHIAAPSVVDVDIGELREHPEHARPRGAARAERVEPRVAHAPAEQQSMIG